MSKHQRRHYPKKLFNVALASVMGATAFGFAPLNLSATAREHPQKTQLIAGNFTGFIASFLRQRRPRRRNISRGNMCSIAPGVVDTYLVWHNKPTFMWNYSGKSETMQLMVRDYESLETIWKTDVNSSDRKITYTGDQPLEANKVYQWRLQGNQNNGNWITFKIMPASEREKISAELQALEQKLKVNRTNPEEIALRKADYFLNYPIKHRTEKDTFNAWSDAMQVLYEVEQPSTQFRKERDKFITKLCLPAESAVEQTQ